MNRDEFLAAVDATLVVPDPLRTEILEELAVHLGDAIDDLMSRGLTPQRAEAEAIERLGQPEHLAGALARAHRRPRYVLAAAGAGTWAAVRDGILGTLAAWLVVILGSVLASTLVRVLGDPLGAPSVGSWSPGWSTVLTATALSLGALFAGAAAVRAIAARGWWTPGGVRVTVAIAGAIVVAVVVLGLLVQPLNWASAIAMLAVPVAFALGARFDSLRIPVRTALLAAVLLILVSVMGVAVAANGSGGSASYQWDTRTHGYEMIGPWWQDPASGTWLDFPTGSSTSMMLGVMTVNVTAASPDVIAEFRDFRLESWRAGPPADGWRLRPGQTAPFATAPAGAAGTTISGTISYNRVPNVDWAQVVLTAVGPDGRRYLLTASGPLQTVFVGSVADWFASLGR